jgi:hypothetical protein
MKKSLKWMLTLLFMSSMIIACGKSKKNESGVSGTFRPINTNQNNPFGGNGNYNGGNNWDAFKTAVNAGSFAGSAGGQSYTYKVYQWNYEEDDCVLIFTCSTYGWDSEPDFTRSNNGTYEHEFGNTDDAVLNALKTVVNGAQNAQVGNGNGSVWQITYQNSVYIIDLSLPIVANPVARQTSQGNYYYLNSNFFGL